MNQRHYFLFLIFINLGFFTYGQTYDRITTIGDLTDGNYLIVGDGNTNDGLMTNSTAGSVYIDYTAITNPGASITSGYTANNVFTITVSSGIITIYNASIGYASWGRTGVTANDASFYNGTIGTNEQWTPSVSGGLWSFSNVSNPSRVLQWNNSAPRFVAYTSNQIKLKLYKETVSGPNISASPTTITGLDYSFGNGPSTSQSFDVTGQLLTAGTTLTSNSANFEISLSAVGGYGNSVTIPVGSANGTTTIYTRLAAGLAENTYNSTISITNSTPSLATPPSIDISGEVTDVYCVVTGDTGYGTSITEVDFSDLNHTSGAGSGYDDFTNNIANVDQGDNYNLSVNLNTVGSYTVDAFVWIDWNQDGDFDDGNEAYDLGDAYATANGPTSLSPLSITVPIGATLGHTRMRVACRYNSNPLGPCDGSDDGEVEDYTVNVGVSCTPTHAVTSFTPTSGPVGTQVTLTGSGFTAGTSVIFSGGITATILSQTATELVVVVPSGITTGVISVEDNGCNVQTSSFSLIASSGACGGLEDLIMTEIYDRNGGSLGYIEVYNGTGVAIDLSTYFIRRYGDATDYADNDYTDYFFAPGVTSIADGSVIYGRISSDANTASPDFDYSNAGFAGINEEDIFELRNASGIIDVYIVPNTNVGYVARRNTNTAGPNATSTPSDWTHLNTENASNLGIFNHIATPNFPTIDTHPQDVGNCTTEAVFTATASPGQAGSLTYAWYFNSGSATGWTLATPANLPLATVTGHTTTTLSLTDGFENYSGYQFYCLVTEDGSCTVASDAAQLHTEVAIWSASGWSSTPSLTKVVVIAEDYDSSVTVNGETSFEACQLIVRTNNTLNIANHTYVVVENNLTVNGAIVVKPYGSFVQHNDEGLVNGAVLTTPSKITVEKETAVLNSSQEYTYWSSPVSGETVGEGLLESSPQRRFIYRGDFYRDSTQETNNDNATANGQDDIDDNADDWEYVSGATIMEAGVGYAATHSADAFGSAGEHYPYDFEGPFNNGVITVPIYRDDAELNDNNWNFIGNPYPSAIDADSFLTQNATIDQTAGPLNGALFLWSHNTTANGSTNGNEALNYAQSDYAIINGTGVTAGGDGVIPNRYIPSGQGFFVSMDNAASSTVHSGTVRTTSVVFNNSMRVTGQNDQFFRTANTNTTNRLRVNLTSDNGIFNQILIGYVNGATNGFDGMYFDAKRNLSTNASSILYSLGNTTDKLAIQGRHPDSLTLDEVIPLGFYTSIEAPTIYTISIAELEGDFLNAHSVYLEDKLLQTLHNLTASPYSFTSETGEFNDRFELQFRDSTLSTGSSEIDAAALLMIELPNGSLQFSVASHLTIKQITIFDALGQIVYQGKGHHAVETIALSNLSQAVYMAKIHLSNGEVINKKGIKQY